MPRKPPVEYDGALYHPPHEFRRDKRHELRLGSRAGRGDRREDIFLDDVDRHDFLKTLAEALQQAEELSRLGWEESDLGARRKSDPGKLRMAARLRRETTLTIKAIASRGHLGSSRSAQVRLYEWVKASEATMQANC
jgi:hypothetical protein